MFVRGNRLRALRKNGLWGGLGGWAFALLACQAWQPPALTHSEHVTVPESVAPLPPMVTVKPAPTPPPSWGPRVEAGIPLTVFAPAQTRRLLLLANPHDHEVRVSLQVNPAGESADPLAVPSPAASSSRRGLPPFGFGFEGSARGVLGLGVRRLMSQERAGARTLDFWINDGSASLQGDRKRRTTLRLETENALFYVDDASGPEVRDERIAHLAEAFERRIRPPLTRVFGTEDRPGADGESRLYIVLSPWVGKGAGREGMMGYFWPRDPLVAVPNVEDLRRHANQKEVIFLSTRILEQPDVTALGTLAHEYQHLLTFCAKSRIDGYPRPEATWLDEGLSMLAMDLAGFGRVGNDPFVAEEIAAYMRDPGLYSLTDWPGNPDERSYGLSYLFVRYLTGRFGLNLVEEIQRTPKTGIAALDEVLQRRGSTAAAAYLDWLRSAAQASTVGDPGSGPVLTPLTHNESRPLRPWGALYFEAAGFPRQGREVMIVPGGSPLFFWQSVSNELGDQGLP